MALTRKGSRRIVVDGIAYRWTIRRRGTYGDLLDEFADPEAGAALRVIVEFCEEQGAVLVVTTDRARRSGVYPFGSESVRPSDVERWIREAVAAGWSPGLTGGPMRRRGTSPTSARRPNDS